MALEVSSVEMEAGNWLVGAAWGWIFLLHGPTPGLQLLLGSKEADWIGSLRRQIRSDPCEEADQTRSLRRQVGLDLCEDQTRSDPCEEADRSNP